MERGSNTRTTARGAGQGYRNEIVVRGGLAQAMRWDWICAGSSEGFASVVHNSCDF